MPIGRKYKAGTVFEIYTKPQSNKWHPIESSGWNLVDITTIHRQRRER
jgi:hypothetical protein